jgi:hypothetical protein
MFAFQRKIMLSIVSSQEKRTLRCAEDHKIQHLNSEQQQGCCALPSLPNKNESRLNEISSKKDLDLTY